MLPWPFWLLYGGLLLQRGLELLAARRANANLRAAGARFVPDDGFGLLVATHVLFFVLAAAEGAFAPWPAVGWWTYVGLAAVALGEGLRAWAIGSLGGRWTTRVVVLPEAPLVTGGPYRWLRHPIYLGVTLMVAGFLAAFGLWASLAVVLPLKGVAVLRRIRREEAALAGLRAVD